MPSPLVDENINVRDACGRALFRPFDSGSLDKTIHEKRTIVNATRVVDGCYSMKTFWL